MIRVRVELVPNGNESESREIAQMVIANDSTGDSNISNYGYVYSDKFDFHEGAVFNFPRRMGIWELIGKCLGSKDVHTNEEFIGLLWNRLK